MVGQLRVPPRLVARLRRVEDVSKFDLFTVKRIRKNWSVRIFITLRTDRERRRNVDKKRRHRGYRRTTSLDTVYIYLPVIFQRER